MPDLEKHNHDNKKSIAAFYQKNWRLNVEESEQILQMLSARTASRLIETAINDACRTAGHPGIVTSNNTFNVATKDRTRKYVGRTEDKVLAEYLTRMRRTDPDRSFKIVIGDGEKPLLRMVYFQNSVMKTFSPVIHR